MIDDPTDKPRGPRPQPSRVPIEGSTGNIYADLGLSDPQTRLRKARVALVIKHLIDDQALTSAEAAARVASAPLHVNFTERHLDDVLQGWTSRFSFEQMLSILTALVPILPPIGAPSPTDASVSASVPASTALATASDMPLAPAIPHPLWERLQPLLAEVAKAGAKNVPKDVAAPSADPPRVIDKAFYDSLEDGDPAERSWPSDLASPSSTAPAVSLQTEVDYDRLAALLDELVSSPASAAPIARAPLRAALIDLVKALLVTHEAEHHASAEPGERARVDPSEHSSPPGTPGSRFGRSRR